MGGGQSSPSTPLDTSPVVMPTGVQPKNSHGDVVVIPVDASQQAEAAFLWYLKHVHRPENQVRVVHCEEMSYTPLLNEQTTQTEAWEEMHKRSKELSNNIIAKYKKKLQDNNITGNIEELSGGRPGEMVVKAVDQNNGTMVVMGTRGYGMVRRTILGSVSEYVVHHAKVPVTIIPKETTHWFF